MSEAGLAGLCDCWDVWDVGEHPPKLSPWAARWVHHSQGQVAGSRLDEGDPLPLPLRAVGTRGARHLCLLPVGGLYSDSSLENVMGKWPGETGRPPGTVLSRMRTEWVRLNYDGDEGVCLAVCSGRDEVRVWGSHVGGSSGSRRTWERVNLG